jgi:hypothetical protein
MRWGFHMNLLTTGGQLDAMKSEARIY